MILRSICALWLLAIPAAAQNAASEAAGAQLRGVDRINGEVFEIVVLAGQTVELQRISIALRACRFPVGNPAGDAYASLEITESDTGKRVFSGWMIASSPALSAMDHPRYDIWVMRCTTS